MMYDEKGVYRKSHDELWIKTKKGRRKLKVFTVKSNSGRVCGIKLSYGKTYDEPREMHIPARAFKFVQEMLKIASREIECEEILNE